jgi:prevent-host-death family protein
VKTITATELARNFRRYLDRVEHQGEELIVVRNQHEIAKIVPGPVRMTAIEALTDLYRTLPEDAGKHWLRDSRTRGTTKELRDAWAI